MARAALLLKRDLTLGTLFDRLERVHGDRQLVTEADAGLDLTYEQAARRVRRWAGGIAAQTEPGDVVVIACPNGYEQLLLCCAAARAGAIPAPVNDKMRKDEIAHVVADSGASLVLRSAVAVDAARPLADAAPADTADVAALFYTSGTTGAPKGAALTHRALVGQAASAALWPTRLHRDEAVIALPVAHIMGFATLVGLAVAGIPTYLLPRFHPVRILDAVEARRATMFVGVPAMYRMLEEAGAADRDLTSVRVWASGADAMPAKVSPPFLGAGRGPLGEALGFALPGYEMRVVGEDGTELRGGQVGELQVKGPGVLKAYWGNEEATAAVLTDDGWLRTGDLARKGPLGLLVFEGRGKHVIKRGGYSVYALEVEQVLETHPAVLEASVVGLPDERMGEVPVAAVRLAEGTTLRQAKLGAFATEHLAEYKVPTRYVAVDELPRTGTTKVQKSELLALFG